MLLITHVIIALAGLIVASYSIYKPTDRLLKSSNLTAILTLISGLLLIANTNASLVKACFSGLIYFSFVLSINYRTYNKLKNI